MQAFISEEDFTGDTEVNWEPKNHRFFASTPNPKEYLLMVTKLQHPLCLGVKNLLSSKEEISQAAEKTRTL